MSRYVNAVLVAGLALGLASCGTVRGLWPFGDKEGPQAVASAGERISIIEFEQTLAPNAALSGRDFFLPAPQPVTAWPLPGGTPEQSLEHVVAAETFTVAWRRDIGVGASRNTQVTSPVVAADGRIFVMDGEATVVAVDAASGNVVWRTNLRPENENAGFGGGLAVANGRVFVTSGYRLASALDSVTGAVIWTTPVDAPIHGAPTVAGDRVYAVDVDNQIVAFETATGDVLWSHQAIAEPARILRASSPAVTGDAIIAPFSSGELVALRAANGQELWTQVLSRTTRTNALSEIRDIAGRPVVSRGFVYAVSHSGVMASMDVRTGAPRWQLPLAGVNAPWVAGDVVYAVANNGELVAANRETGQVYWIRDLNEGRAYQTGGFLGIGDRTVRPVWSGPVLASNRLLLVNSEGELVAVDPKTGVQTAVLDMSAGPAYIAPIAYQGALYVLTDDGRLVSIR